MKHTLIISILLYSGIANASWYCGTWLADGRTSICQREVEVCEAVTTGGCHRQDKAVCFNYEPRDGRAYECFGCASDCLDWWYIRSAGGYKMYSKCYIQDDI